jgi:hypothetical protein
MINATETTGTTTATAIVPLGERPPDPAAVPEVASAAESVALEEGIDVAPVLDAVWVDVTTTTVVPWVDVNVVFSSLEVVDGAVVVEEVEEVEEEVDEVEVGVGEVDVGSGVDVVGSVVGVLLVLLVVELVVVGSVELEVVGAGADEEVVSVEEVEGWAADVSLLVSGDPEVCTTGSAALEAIAAAAAPAPAALDAEAISIAILVNVGQ